MESTVLDSGMLAQLTATMAWVADGARLSAGQVQELVNTWQDIVQPRPTAHELFDLVDAQGQVTGVTAPRWLCHLLGLCHRTVHVILHTPQGWLVLQVRGQRVDWPGCLDLAVTGHVHAGLGWQEAARHEAAEELGLDVEPAAGMLAAPGLHVVGDLQWRREADSLNPPVHICHVTQVFAAYLTCSGLGSLHFADGEVEGLYLCSPSQARRLIAEEPHRVAPGLAQTLPRYLAR